MTAERERLGELYRSHAPVVLRRARQILGDEDQAREVVQEIFLGLLHRPDQFEGRSSMTTYLYAATTHMCLNRLRDARNRDRLLDERVAPATESTAPASAAAIVELRRLLPRLPAEEAAAAIYHYLDGMSHAEIARVQGCSRRQVGYLLERLHSRVAEEAER